MPIDEKLFAAANKGYWNPENYRSDDRLMAAIEAYEAAKAMGDASARKDEVSMDEVNDGLRSAKQSESPATHQPDESFDAFYLSVCGTGEADINAVYVRRVAKAAWDAALKFRAATEREAAQPDELREAALHDKAFADGARAGWNAALSTNPRHDDYMRRMDKLSDEARAVLARHTERESGHLKYLEDWHYVTQSLIGTVELHLSTGDYEKAKQRMAHYKALLPHFSVDEQGRRG